MKKYQHSLLTKLTSLDVAYLLQHSPWLYLAKGISSVLVLLVAYIFANYASPQTYGTYKYILSIVGILSAFTLSGLPEVIAREMAKERTNILRDAFRTSLLWHGIFILGSLTISGHNLLHGNTEIGFSFLVIAFLYPLIQAASVAKKYLTGCEEFKRSALQELTATIIRSVSVISVTLMTNSPLYIICTYFVSEAITATGFYLWLLTREKFKPDAKIRIGSYKFAQNMSAIKIFNKISLYLDQVLIFQLLGPAQLAIYAIAVALPKELESLNKTIQALILPKVTNLPIKSIKKIIGYRALVYMVPFLGIVVIYYFTSELIFKILFPQYMEGLLISQIAILTLLCSPHNLYRQTLFAHNKTKSLYFLDTFISITKLILSVILISLFGLLGAVWSLVISRLLRVITTILLVKFA